MKQVVFHPQRLDVAAFAKAQAELQGSVALADLTRLAESLVVPFDAAPGEVAWQAAGSQRAVLGGASEVRVRLQASTQVWQTCQRCLAPMAQTLTVDRRFRFMRTEDEAAQLDEDTDDEDVLVISRSLDLLCLLEDELIMALPIVPRHESCPVPLPGRALGAFESALRSSSRGRAGSARDLAEESPDADRAAEPAGDDRHPFAVLKKLKLKSS